MRELKLRRDAVAPVLHGHPWVYRDGLVGSAAVGEPVSLLDERGRVVGWGLADEGGIAVRVLGKRVLPLQQVLRERVGRADRLRWQVVSGDTNCWRVVNGAGDGLPGLVLDRYGELAVLRVYSAAWLPHLQQVVDVIAALPWVSTVYRRLGVKRVDGATGGLTLSGPEVPESLVVKEHGLKFLVRPEVGQKTGLFLDQREHRRLVGELAAGRSVVNLFAYSGGFSVYAAAAGAARVVTVDLSPGAIEDARENFRLNGLAPERHGFEVADVFKWKPQGSPDLLVCDPPSLTHGKDSDTRARRAYRNLAAKVGASVALDGLLVTSSCTARLDMERWMQSVRDGLRRCGQWSLLTRSEAPADHPVAFEHSEGRYLKLAVLRRLSR